MLKAPKFWYYKTDSFLSNALYPLSLMFRLGTKIRNLISKEREAKLPIICVGNIVIGGCLLYTSPSTRDQRGSRMPSSA